MRTFKRKAFLTALLDYGYLDKFVESGWCWDGCQTKHPINLTHFLLLTIGWTSSCSFEIHAKVRLLLNKKGLKGVDKFMMPEQISWCECQPRLREHENNKEEFFNIVCKLSKDK